jgi:hypothetical protein
LAFECNCEFANFYSAMAYPGSALYRQAITDGTELPESWIGYSQHSYECHPLPTEALSSVEVLRFRDEAFTRYFTSAKYLAMVEQKFGKEVVEHLQQMVAMPLPRALYQNQDV